MKRALLVVAVLVAILATLPTLAPEFVVRVATLVERSLGGVTRSQINVSGDAIAYLEGGSGEVLVLLHGFGGDKDNWVRMARYLTPELRVIALDLPPFGESVTPEGAHFSVDAQVERVRAATRALGLQRFHLGGNSMGGAIAGVYAGRYPEDLLSLWLLAPGGVRGAEQSEFEARLEKGDNPLLVDSPDDFDALLDFSLEKRPYIPGPIVRYLGSVAIERRPLYEAVFRDLRSEALGLEKRMGGSAVPTLITWGARDRVLHVSGASVLGNILPNATVDIMDETGHVPMVEQPERCAERFLAFRKTLPGT